MTVFTKAATGPRPEPNASLQAFFRSRQPVESRALCQALSG